jgi:hypothetical protein
VARWKIASALLSGKVKTQAGLFVEERPDAGHDQCPGGVDRVVESPLRLQREVEGGAEEQ